MKKIFLILTILGIFVGCKKEVTPIQKNTVLEGTIDAKMDSLMAVVVKTNEDFDIYKTAVVNDSFSFVLSIDTLAQVYLLDSTKVHNLYISPKDTLEIRIANDSLEVVQGLTPYTLWSNEAYIRQHPLSLVNDTLMPSLIKNQLMTFYQKRGKEVLNKRIPLLIFKGADDSRFNTLENSDSYRLLTFWADWDSTSIQRVKELDALSKKLKTKQIEFMTIAFGDNDSIWKEQIKTYKIPGKNALLPRGFADEKSQKLNIQTMPANLIVNQQSIIDIKNLFGKDLTDYLVKNVPIKEKKKK